MAYITRDDAIDVLRKVISSDILNEDLQDALEDICLCIENENDGYHSWGADDDFAELHIAYREDMWTDELKEMMQKIHTKYSFTPAPYEAEMFEEDEDEDEEI